MQYISLLCNFSNFFPVLQNEKIAQNISTWIFQLYVSITKLSPRKQLKSLPYFLSLSYNYYFLLLTYRALLRALDREGDEEWEEAAEVTVYLFGKGSMKMHF